MGNGIYRKQPSTAVRRIYFTGSTALYKGQGLCFDRDYTSAIDGEAATDCAGVRDHRVELPTTTNNRWFAGVTARDYEAKTGGQYIEIYEPGSVCEIAVGLATVVDTTVLTCTAGSGDPGRFTRQGFKGRGTAIALQTTETPDADVDTPGPISNGWTGEGDFTFSTLNLSQTGKFADAAEGDKVVVVGGRGDAGDDIVTPGIYTIATVTDDDNVVLSSAPATAAALLTYYVIRDNPTVLAYLQTGGESGLIEIVSPLNNASTATSMVGGMTFVAGGYALGNGDSTHTLANGTEFGMLKGFHCLGALTTNDYKVTVTSGIQDRVLDEVTTGQSAQGAPLALASFELNAAGELIYMQWWGTWVEQYAAGLVLNAS